MDKHATEGRHSPGLPYGGETACRLPRAARLMAIRELVQTNNYRVPPLLVAERMIERAVTQYHFLDD